MLKSLRFVGSVIALSVALSVALTANAYETRWGVDPALRVPDLKASGKISLKSSESRGTHTIDASAVLVGVSFARLKAVSADYDHYAQMGMPNVESSHVVEKVSPDLLYSWTQMTCLGNTSMHYLEVQFIHGLSPQGGEGTQWQLAHRKGQWPYREQSAFTRLDGSWYMEPLSDGSVYVRYFLSATPDDSAWPDFLVNWIVSQQLRDGVEKVIQTLAKNAKTAR